jgi:ribosome-binding factor A
MKSQRQLQVGENIKRIMSEIFLRDGLFKIKGNHLTIIEADSSPDLKNIKIYIDIIGDKSFGEEIIQKLNDLVPYFRHKIAGKINLRIVPEIIFLLDNSHDYAIKISSLIDLEAKNFDVKKTPNKKFPKKKK